MSEATKLSIPFTSYTVSVCQCAKCPVEQASKCARDQWTKVGKTVCDTKPINREEVPAVYCSTGEATCSDLDPSKMCICTTCRVFAEHRLGSRTPPVGYYCRDGMAR